MKLYDVYTMKIRFPLISRKKVIEYILLRKIADEYWKMVDEESDDKKKKEMILIKMCHAQIDNFEYYYKSYKES